ncbi:uncharacterized protein LOC132296602 [Cornus florida]|uniref:uncharacterized protein LOC132296602 n=1 Tax=Cornus florida TaxID=4283 RepID=UPI002899EC4C|nr:uncharacterized protein LOC132296602 [Cornus florida]
MITKFHTVALFDERDSDSWKDAYFVLVTLKWLLAVEKIPVSFLSEENYLGSYVFPLLEETRAELASSMEILDTAPFAVFKECKIYGELLYDVKVDYWRNTFNDRAKEPYRTLPGDIFVISDVKPETISDLQRSGRTWTFASVTYITENENEDDSTITQFRIKASKDIEVKDGMQKSMFVVFLRNITRSKRIWNMLHKLTNMKIIKKILCTDSMVEETCDRCSGHNNSQLAERFSMRLLSKLNEPHTEAILASLHKMECNHKTYVKLIWGPPGTGKTMTVSVMLFSLLSLNCHRILTCAPTSVAIKEVASRVLKMVKESFEAESRGDYLFCPLGDILLLGNEDRLKIGGSDIKDIYLDYRVKRLEECLGICEEGWKHCLDSMIDFLENCVSQYHIFVENELIKAKELCKEGEPTEVELKSFLEFARDRFKSTASPLRSCLFIICTHLPKHYIPEHNFQNIVSVFNLLDSLEKLFQENVDSEELEEILSRQETVEDTSESLVDPSLLLLSRKQSKCLSVLRTLQLSLEELNLPSVTIRDSIMEFCFQRASLIFCTTSSSYKLHWVKMEPLTLLVIDEAAQLKECESTIPLQLPGMRHAILIGDERQLPAMVMSEVSGHAGFGRSLFERLSSSRHSKHLLNIQYRMHPKISFFPNLKFYHKSILDAPNVSSKSYERHYLPGPMFGPYSFINVIGGKEELDDVGHSRRNMVEVAIILKIVQNLYKAWNGSEKKLSIGVVSPYAAQVVAIQEKLGRKYENLDGFMVTVKSIDGFQGGEDDIVIMSTVRTNKEGSIGFLASRQRTNVALTRARHCLWVLGNEKTLSKSRSVWTELVQDAKYRQCFFNADEDRDMAKTILNVKKELDQLDDLLNEDSVLFKSARWQVLFSDQFRKSFGKLTSDRTKKSVLNLLLKLSSGWRPKKRNVDSVCESSSQIVKQFKVEGLYAVCTIDIVKKSRYIQVLKVWDILPLEGISQLVKRLDSIFAMYTDDFINCCKEKSLEGDLEIPKSWGTSYDVVQFKNICNNEFGSELSVAAVDGRSYVEKSKVSESLLLMKFYSLSSGVVRHLLSGFDGGELDLPFEVTDQEMEIILFSKSIFIVGRSGTGKTTVLTMKLFRKEQQHRMATDGFYVGESSTTKGSRHINEFNECIGETKGTVLRQLFVTVSPKLCYAVKQHVSRLKSFTHGRNFPAETSSIDMDDMEEFKDIPDSFVEIPPNKYPLVITFHKFLMMLDGTLGNSYFERFSDVRDFSHHKTGASRSVALQTFTRVKEVNYDRFCSVYWPHFNTKLIKNLDPAVVFTEIISNIKGGLQAGGTLDGKLEDIFNEDLYKNQVKEIPVSFQSVEHYLGSYVFPLLEETRAELASSMEILDTAPFAVFKECKIYGELLYDVKVDYWRNTFNDRAKEPYRTLPGDIFVISDVKPETISDLQRAGRTWTFASVTNITEDENEDDSTTTHFRIKASKDIEVGMWKSMFVVFLMNITTSKRIWNTLHMFTNMKIIKKILCSDSVVRNTMALLFHKHWNIQLNTWWK